MSHPAPCASIARQEVLGADGDDEISGGVCVRLPMPRVWGRDDASGYDQGHGGWVARAGAQARSTMWLVTESCDSEACSCMDNSSKNDVYSKNDTSRVEERYVGVRRTRCLRWRWYGWLHLAVVG